MGPCLEGNVCVRRCYFYFSETDVPSLNPLGASHEGIVGDVVDRQIAMRPRIFQRPLVLNISACPLSKVDPAREELESSTPQHRVIRVQAKQLFPRLWKNREAMGLPVAGRH